MNRQLTSEELRAGKVSRAEFATIPRRKISIMLDGIKSGSNLGNIFRVADAMRIEKVWVCGSESVFSTKFKRASRKIETWVDWECRNDAAALVAELNQAGNSIVAMELCDKSEPLFSMEYTLPLVLVFGGESAGVSWEVLSLCDGTVHLPMLGMGNSINLSNSVAIALYEAKRSFFFEG